MFWVTTGGLFWEGPRGGGTPNYVKIIISNISTADIKKTLASKIKSLKRLVLGDHRGGRYPQTTSKYLHRKYLLTAKNTGTLA